MNTRYALPGKSDSARSARTLAALALVISVLGLCLLVAFVPEGGDAPVATSPDDEAVQAQPVAPFGA